MKKMTRKLAGMIVCLLLAMALTFNVTAASVAISKKTATINVKGTVTLKLKNAKGTVKWSTSNKKVATVTSKGKVTGVKAGKATITATFKRKKYTCKVTVKAAAKSKYTAAQIKSYAKKYKGKKVSNLINIVGNPTKKIKGAACDGGGYEYEYRWTVSGKTVRVAVDGKNIITDVA